VVSFCSLELAPRMQGDDRGVTVLARTKESGVAEPRPGRPEAAAAIWSWRDAGHAAAPEAGLSRTRLRGALQGALGLGAGALIFRFGPRPPAFVVLAIAGTVLLSALVSPRGLYAWIEGAFAALGRLLGQALTWLLMPALFYLVFLPYGILFRRGRRDSMKRFFEADAPTYWKPRDPAKTAPAAHDRQY